jgi:5'-methylthioadenosine phosphorylase
MTSSVRPSDALIFGKIKGIDCVILARHGRKHHLSPTNVNYRANLWALKQAGCTVVIATSACGSLREEIRPGQIVLVDQFIDRTTKRAVTFYDGGEHSPKGVCHIPMAHPFCEHLRKVLLESMVQLGVDHHATGTTLTIEGPRFSSRAESQVWRSYGASIVGMTTVPEVVLARELAIPYATIALVTDYDCFDENKEHVSVEMVMKQMIANAKTCTDLLLHAIPAIAAKSWTSIVHAYEEEVKTSTMLAD